MVKSVVTPTEHRQRIKESERALEMLRAEPDRLDYSIERAEQLHGQRKEAAARANVAELKRSKLTALEKSRIIQEVGGEAYLKLPW